MRIFHFSPNFQLHSISFCSSRLISSYPKEERSRTRREKQTVCMWCKVVAKILFVLAPTLLIFSHPYLQTYNFHFLFLFFFFFFFSFEHLNISFKLYTVHFWIHLETHSLFGDTLILLT